MTQLISKRLKVAGRTDVGCVRTLNEDNYHINEDLGMLIVADGMGGHDAGEVASAQVIETITEFLANQSPTPPDGLMDLTVDDTMSLVFSDLDDQSEEPTLDDIPNPLIATITSSIMHANSRVNAVNQKKGYPDGMGMGSTVVGLWYPEYADQPIVFHVGDSRLYLYRRGRLLQVTQDHSMYQQWVNFGGAGIPPAQNILLQAMGPSNKVTPDVRFQNVEKGDKVLICSDGLSGMVNDATMEKVLHVTNANNLDESCAKLVELARQRGGKDNITVILGYFI